MRQALESSPFCCSPSRQVAAALDGLRASGDLFSCSVDAVCELVWVSVDHETGSVGPGMMPLVQVGVPA